MIYPNRASHILPSLLGRFGPSIIVSMQYTAHNVAQGIDVQAEWPQTFGISAPVGDLLPQALAVVATAF